MNDNRLRNLINLSHVKRWGIVPTLHQESVAEHSFRVAAISEYLADELAASNPDIDRLGLLRMALTHDLEECYTGDIPAPAKRLFDNHGILDRAMESLNEFETEAQENHARERFIVKVSDLLDALWSMRVFGIAPYSTQIVERITNALEAKKGEAVKVGFGRNEFGVAMMQAVFMLTQEKLLVPPWMKP